MILAVHLLIVQATTWVLVPLDILLSHLWVGAAKEALFKGLLHINVARELAVEYLMQW